MALTQSTPGGRASKFDLLFAAVVAQCDFSRELGAWVGTLETADRWRLVAQVGSVVVGLVLVGLLAVVC